ncbi:MAG: membrane integrity-associated transporter subunit PqiC [Variovorax sp.]|nr:membrane integrity-associated transporter subunit PqiC [Variovorax sp.]
MHESLGKAGAIAALAASLLAAGCGSLPDKPTRATLYDFGPGPVSAAPADRPAGAAALQPIALADIEANARLDGTQMLYRLGYADANEVRPYGQSRWSQSPAQLLRQRLREALAATRPVLGPEESATIARTEGRVPDTLRVTLEEFSQFFDAPASSVGLIRVHATLIRTSPGGDRVLAQRSFSARRAAPSHDAPGGVKALADASDALVAELVAWANQPR